MTTRYVRTSLMIDRDPADEIRAWLDSRITPQPAPWESVPTSHRSLFAVERVDRSDARCTGHGASSPAVCPRHDPGGYTDAYARHATDLIGPIGGAR